MTLRVPSLLAVFFVGILALFLTGCDSGGSSGSSTGTLETDASTTGSPADPDGYTVTVDEETSQDVSTNGTARFTALTEGPHRAALSGLAANCTVAGDNPKTPPVFSGDTTRVTFSVKCTSTDGALEVSATTAGETPDEDGYVVTLDGSQSTRIDPNASKTFRDLSKGDYSVELSGLQPNCTVAGSNPKTVSVAPMETSEAAFTLNCPLARFNSLAFESDRDGNDEIYTVRPDGTGLKRVTDNAAADGGPAWSPDGTRLAFATDRDGNLELYTTRLDGTDLKRITDNSAIDGAVAWSPDGSRIAFNTNRDGNFEIYTSRPDGTDLERVTNNSALDTSPVWSPDGSRLAFRTDRDGNEEIYTVRPDGTDLTQVTNNSASDTAPAWSPDGSRIAFASERSGNFEIYTVRPNGTDLEQVTNDSSSDRDPAWSPTGRRLAFNSVRDGDLEIYTIRTNGTSLRQITTNSDLELRPAWGPSR